MSINNESYFNYQLCADPINNLRATSSIYYNAVTILLWHQHLHMGVRCKFSITPLPECQS